MLCKWQSQSMNYVEDSLEVSPVHFHVEFGDIFAAQKQFQDSA